MKRRNQTTRLVQRQKSPKNWPPDVILKAMIYSCRNIYINWILRRIFSLANDFNYDSSGKGCWQHIACRATQNRLCSANHHRIQYRMMCQKEYLFADCQSNRQSTHAVLVDTLCHLDSLVGHHKKKQRQTRACSKRLYHNGNPKKRIFA